MLRYAKIKKYFLGILLAAFLPQVVFAAAPTNLREFAAFVVRVLQSLAALLFASLALGLLYGVILYFIHSDNEQKRTEIKSYLLWGVIGIIVVMGLWGILALLRVSIFGTSTVGIPQISPPT